MRTTASLLFVQPEFLVIHQEAAVSVPAIMAGSVLVQAHAGPIPAAQTLAGIRAELAHQGNLALLLHLVFPAPVLVPTLAGRIIAVQTPADMCADHALHRKPVLLPRQASLAHAAAPPTVAVGLTAVQMLAGMYAVLVPQEVNQP